MQGRTTVCVSTDTGATWTSVSLGISFYNVRASARAGSILIAGTYGNGVYVSTNSGANCNAVNSGLKYTIRVELRTGI